MKKLSVALLFAGVCSVSAQNPIHVTYLWHMHQPIYYPYESVGDTDANGRFNFSVAGVHNERTGNYTSWPKNAVQQGADRGMAHAGAQASFSGSLGENLNGVWGSGWFGDYRWARNTLRTSLNNPRLDMVGIAYHHSLMPLTCKESMVMQIRLHKEMYKEMWDTTEYSKGFWPPECAFATWIIPALVEEGLEWAIVDNGHFDRACKNYPWVDATSIRPNPADQINPDPALSGSQWVQLQNVWAPSKVSAPWGYQPHYVKHVDPYTGTEQKIIAVPAARYEGNENGRGGYGAFKPENVWGTHAANGINNDASKPMLILCHSDGDNYGMKNADAWHAQHGFFLDMCQSNPNFDNTTVQDYLDMYPPDVNDVIHVEPGSWIGIDGGTPYFDKWREENGGGAGNPNEHPDFWSWSVIVAAQNRVLHADALENSYSINDVQWGINSDTARAWHFYLQAETSCHWYWDYDRANPWDGNATRGCNLAVAEADKVIARHGTDPIGPSIFPPQRDIYNPGGKHWNETENQPSDFTVWSFIDDANGVASATVYVRQDLDGDNPISENDNEVFAQNAAKVGAWSGFAMSADWYPSEYGPMVPSPAARAQRYQALINGYNNVLLDYYIEAVDTNGNTNRSDIMHVYVGESGSVNPVTFSPSSPDRCPGSTVATVYNSASRNLSGANPVTLVISFDDWATSNEFAMTGSQGGIWFSTNDIPTNASTAQVRFRDGGTWDDNNGQGWSAAIAECAVPSSATFNPPNPDGCVAVTISYDPGDGVLKNADPVYIHVGFNEWQSVITPDPAMAFTGGVWKYTYQAPAGAVEINAVFNDGGSTWDNNNGMDWSVAVSNCVSSNAVVNFSPGAPRECDPLTVIYNPAGGVLSNASPVYVHYVADGAAAVTQEMASIGASWIHTNTSLDGASSLSVTFGDTGATTVDDNSGSGWMVAISTCSTAGPSDVVFDPAEPTGCVDVDITYSPNNGPLAGVTQVYAHVGHDNWQDVVANAVMSENPDGSWTYTYSPPDGTEIINVAFNDGAGTWDNNTAQDWAVNVSGCGSPTSSVLRLVQGSPIVRQGPTNQQNHVGEAFDMNLSGGYARTTDQSGFGSFGRVHANFDANNFYIGGYGLDMVGDNNAMVLFLETDALAEDVNNLWNLSGSPNGLDSLHNVWLNQGADIAIIIGDEWGDGQFPTFNLGSGYDMGQGIYSIGSTSFTPVTDIKLTQFDGTGSVATATADDDGDRMTDRWMACIPWTSLGSTNGINGISNMYLYGVVVSDGVSGNDRYLSGNYLADSVDPATNGNYGFSFLNLEAIPIQLPVEDSNGNGIPDSWEMEHFGSLGVVTENSDWDNDGVRDRDEYLAGTLPKNAGSRFEMTHDTEGFVPSGFVIRWSCATGKTYGLYRAIDVDGIYSNVVDNIPATPPENVFTDMFGSSRTLFYRVRTQE